jgi:hypothetical protein
VSFNPVLGKACHPPAFAERLSQGYEFLQPVAAAASDWRNAGRLHHAMLGQRRMQLAAVRSVTVLLHVSGSHCSTGWQRQALARRKKPLHV